MSRWVESNCYYILHGQKSLCGHLLLKSIPMMGQEARILPIGLIFSCLIQNLQTEFRSMLRRDTPLTLVEEITVPFKTKQL